MSSIFDSKEEVLDIQLTSYGRFLLSKGKFKPEYYAFFDDDVIYDINYCTSSAERQNDIQERILNETPILKPQVFFRSLDENIAQNSYIISDNTAKLKLLENQNISEKNYALALPLGNSSHNNQFYPAWNISAIHGFISESKPYLDNSNGSQGTLRPFLDYPQITMENQKFSVVIKKNEPFLLNEHVQIIEPIVFNPTVQQVAADRISGVFGGQPSSEAGEYYITMREEHFILEIAEENVDDIKENFDIEIFLEEEVTLANGIVKKDWKQLNFPKKLIKIKNNILLDEPENIKAQDLQLDGSFAENYLEILVDQEIELTPKQLIKLNIYDTNAVPPFGADC